MYAVNCTANVGKQRMNKTFVVDYTKNVL